MFLWVKFLEVELLDQRVYTFVILLEIAKSLSIEFVPIYIQISNESVSHASINTISCQTFWSLPIW